MRLVQLTDVGVFFPGRTLFSRLTWSIFRGERYGLVGPNGAGKTTLLKLLTGSLEPTDGTISRSRGITVGYLPQTGISHRGRTLFEEAWNGLPDLPQLQNEIAEIHSQLEKNQDDPDLIEELGVLQHRWQDLEGYRAEARVSEVLSGLGFIESDFQQRVEEFSGGWQMRIALSKLLLSDPDLLLLDEPTNHLDLTTLIWLENFISKYSGTCIIVSHDRSLLDRVVSGIAEIERGELTLYPGNYSSYEKARDERREQLEKEREKVDTQRKHLESFVERFRYKASKAKQAQSRIKMLERLDTVETVKSTKKVHFRFPPAIHSGKILFELENIGKSYGEKSVFSDINTVIRRGERIALIGVNGAGKSTFCRLLAGVDSSTSGSIIRGHGLAVDYFAQDADFHLHVENTVLEEIEMEGAALTQAQLRGLLGAFLFSGDDVYKKVSVLSGGEKSRLALGKMLLRPANFLILDEPTNHLDMASQDVLLDALRHYKGTVLVVSHDRYFLDRLVDRVFELENGNLHDWPGTLTEYMTRKGLLAVEATKSSDRAPVSEPRESNRKAKDAKRAKAEIRNRYSKAIREYQSESEKLQRQIEQSESRKRNIEVMLSEENFYRDAVQSKKILTEYNSIRENLPMMIKRWEEVSIEYQKLQAEREEAMRSLSAGEAV